MLGFDAIGSAPISGFNNVPPSGEAEVTTLPSWIPKTEEEKITKDNAIKTGQYYDAQLAYVKVQEAAIVEQQNSNRTIKRLTRILALAAVIQLYPIFKGIIEPTPKADQMQRSVPTELRQLPYPPLYRPQYFLKDTLSKKK